MFGLELKGLSGSYYLEDGFVQGFFWGFPLKGSTRVGLHWVLQGYIGLPRMSWGYMGSYEAFQGQPS